MEDKTLFGSGCLDISAFTTLLDLASLSYHWQFEMRATSDKTYPPITSVRLSLQRTSSLHRLSSQFLLYQLCDSNRACSWTHNSQLLETCKKCFIHTAVSIGAAYWSLKPACVHTKPIEGVLKSFWKPPSTSSFQHHTGGRLGLTNSVTF